MRGPAERALLQLALRLTMAGMSRLPAAVAAHRWLVGAARHVQAQEAEPLRRTTAVYGVGGLGTPVGYLGIEIVQRFGPELELTAGIRAGLAATSAHNGCPLQWALMSRVRIGDTVRNNLTLGAGLSGGNYADIPFYCDNCTTYPVEYMLWANFADRRRALVAKRFRPPLLRRLRPRPADGLAVEHSRLPLFRQRDRLRVLSAGPLLRRAPEAEQAAPAPRFARSPPVGSVPGH